MVEKTGDWRLMGRQREADVDQLFDLLCPRLADLDSRRQRGQARRDFLDAMRVLLAEAESKPGVHEARVVRRHECVLARSSFVDPASCCPGVEVAEVLGLLDRVPRELDPDVLAPDLDVARGADQVADDSPVAQPCGA